MGSHNKQSASDESSRKDSSKAQDRSQAKVKKSSQPESLEELKPEKEEKKDPHPINALTIRFPEQNLTVLSHFYRGELARANVWRQKMDMTTHWSIITTTAVMSLVFTSPSATHVVVPLGSLLLFLLLNIEGRRYRFFDVWRTRVRMLEVHFLLPAVFHSVPLIEGNWREVICNDLLKPTYKISYWEAVGRRLHRNYIWLFALLLGTWLIKVLVHPGQDKKDPTKALSFYDSCGVEGIIPPWIVLGGAIAFHAMIFGLYIFSIKSREATGEIRRKDPNRKQWEI